MKIIFDYFDDASPTEEVMDTITDEVERVAGLIREGYTSGELTAAEGRGWWSIERGESSDARQD